MNIPQTEVSGIENPIASSYWQEAARRLIAVGESENIDVRHCATLSVRIVDFLLFLRSHDIELTQLTPISWYRPFDFAIGSPTGTIEEWRVVHPELALEHPSSTCLVPVDAVYRLNYQDCALLLATPTQQIFWGSGIEDINPLLLAGESQEAVASLAKAFDEMRRRRASRVTFWGAGIVGEEPPPTFEEQIILDPELKRDLLQYVDRFWRHQEFARARGLPVRRGLLLAGRPGTGKTQFIRHIVTRFPDAAVHVMTPANDQSATAIFPAMLSRVKTLRQPSIVIVEDIDRFFEQKSVTPQFFLNALDGLLSVEATILWIATTNDPSALKLNILDRPGRFDRVAVFPEPGPVERAAMILRFCDRQLDAQTLESSVYGSRGLSGAHIREACVAARLRELDCDTPFEVLLDTELDIIRKQHQSTRRYELDLNSTSSGVGFTSTG